jgi:hypothetical protein
VWPGQVDLELSLPQRHHVAVLQPAVGREALGLGHAPLGARGVDLVDPEGVVGVRPLDRDAGQRLQGRGPARMVQMAVGDPDLLQRQALVGERLHQARNLAAWIDDRGLQGLGTPDDGAVLLQRRHRRDQGADRQDSGLRLRRVHLIPMIGLCAP